jgi:DNA modification methylase
MHKGEFEIVTIKPRWSPINLVAPGGRTEKKRSILSQLNDRYIKKGWRYNGEIVWAKNCEFAVVRLKPPSPG